MHDLRDLLHGIELSQYYDLLKENHIDGELIADLTLEDLKEIGVKSLGHRKKIFAAIQLLTDTESSELTEKSETASQDAHDARAERREVTTVFADLTGYTNLSRELDTEDLHDVLSAFYERFNEIVIRLGGTIDRHIGDCVMAVFGAPVSHGNDVERALRTTIELHRAMEEISRRFGRELSVHIGAAAGNVLFSTMGYGHRKEQDFTLTGETVNLASRLADQAKGKETLIDDEIFLSLSHKIECDAPITLEVKGFDQPVLAHRFKGFRETGIKRQLIGRDEELSVFLGALDRCVATGTGETLYLCADAGMGKSRLLQEIGTEAAVRGLVCHSTLILDFGLGGGQNPINALVAKLCGLGDQAQQSAIAGVTSLLQDEGALDDNSATMLTSMLGGELDRAQAVTQEAMSDEARSDAQLEALRQIVRHFSAKHPLVLTIEDAHWADPKLLPAIMVLSDESQTAALVLIVTSRPEGAVMELDVEPVESTARVRRMDLEPLSIEDATRLARSTIRPSEEVLRQCVERAQGNPLFLEQLLRHAHDGDSGEVIPGSIQSLIQARFDRLASVDRKILQAAATLGQRFSMTAVTQIADIEVYDEQVLIEASLIRPIDDGYLFAHALIRDAVLRTILRDDLRALHRAAAEWFRDRDLVLFAEHLKAARDAGAARAFLLAAREAQSKYQKDLALEFADKGLDCKPGTLTIGHLLRLKGDMLRGLGRGEEAILAHTEARDCATEPQGRCRALIGIVAAMRILDRIDEAYELLDEAQLVAEEAGLTAELSEIHYFRGSLHFPRGNLDGCLQNHSTSLDYAREAGLPERQALALSGLGDAHYARGRMFTAHSVIEQCLALCDEHGFGSVEGSNRFMLATVKIYMNETAEALSQAQQSAGLAAQVGSKRPEIVSRLTAGWILTSMARYNEARIEIETGLELAAELGAKRFEPFLEETLARVEFAEGNFAEAARVAEVAETKLRELKAESFIGPWVLSAVALTTADPSRRRSVLKDGEELLAKGCVGHNYYRFYRNAMQACLNAQDWDEAVRYADALAAYTAEEPTPWSDYHIDRTRALVDLARGKDVEADITGLLQTARAAKLFNALPELNKEVSPAD